MYGPLKEIQVDETPKSNRRKLLLITLALFLGTVAFASLAKIQIDLNPEYRLAQKILEWLENSSSNITSNVSFNHKVDTLESVFRQDQEELLRYQESLARYLRGTDTSTPSEPPELSQQLQLRYGAAAIDRNWQLSSLLLQVAEGESNVSQKNRLRAMARFLIGVIHSAESGQF